MKLKLEDVWEYLKTFDPTMLRSIYAAIVLLVGTLGLSIPGEWDARITAILAALAIIIPIIQGLITRGAVVPNAVHEAAVEKALYTEVPPSVEAEIYPFAAGLPQDDDSEVLAA